MSGHGSGTAGGQWQVSTAYGIHPVWRPDGKELYYLNPAGAMMATPITVTGSRSKQARRWCSFPRASTAAARTRERVGNTTPPPTRFLINTALDDAAAPITQLQHWHPEGKK